MSYVVAHKADRVASRFAAYRHGTLCGHRPKRQPRDATNVRGRDTEGMNSRCTRSVAPAALTFTPGPSCAKRATIPATARKPARPRASQRSPRRHVSEGKGTSSAMKRVERVAGLSP